MELSRRTLLRTVLVGCGTLVAGTAGVAFLGGDLRRAARGLFYRITDPPLPPSPPGPLDEVTVAALRATAEALVGDPGREARYLAPFRWRSRNLPGYRKSYQGYARFVDAEARRMSGSAFAALPVADRRRLVSEAFPGGRLRQALGGLGRPDRMRWRRHVVREMLRTYAATDAWSDLGYAAWPGMPRGLEAYRVAPPGAGTPR